MQQFAFLSSAGGGSFVRPSSKFQWTTIAMIISLGMICPLGAAEAATVSFTFQASAEASAFGTPSLGNLNLPTTVTGSALVIPFGSAAYSEAGTVTFAALPTGGFAPASTQNTFTFSFDAEQTRSVEQTVQSSERRTPPAFPPLPVL